MHYYQFNIGDYASHTRHLSIIEDIAYRRLLDAYYLHEQPLNSGLASVARLIGMREYEEEVNAVLSEFFQLTEEGWISTRADKEIAHYHSKIEQASKAGKASAQRRFNSRSTDVQPTNNQEPITNNHKPSKERATKVACPPDVAQQVWNDWLQLRKAKKAPVTETVVNNAISEAGKAGISLNAFLSIWCARGSQGLQADWLKPDEKKTYQQSFAERDELAKRKKWEEMTGRKWPEDYPYQIVDVTPTFLEIEK